MIQQPGLARQGGQLREEQTTYMIDVRHWSDPIGWMVAVTPS